MVDTRQALENMNIGSNQAEHSNGRNLQIKDQLVQVQLHVSCSNFQRNWSTDVLKIQQSNKRIRQHN